MPTLSALRQLESQPATAGGDRGHKRRRIPLAIWLGGFVVIGLTTILVGIWQSRIWIPTPEISEIRVPDDDPDVSEAVAAARQTVKESPRSAAAWGHLAMVLHGNTLENTADACYAAAAALEPTNPDWPYLRGYMHQDGPGGPEMAIPYYQLAADLSPPNLVSRLRLGDMLLAQGRLDEAAAEFDKVLSADPADANAQFGQGAIAVARRDYPAAKNILESIAGHPLVQKRVCELLGNVYERLGESAAAEQQRERLAALPEDAPRPDDPMIRVGELQVGLKARLRKAKQLLGQQHDQEALSVLREAVQRYPKSDEAWSHLGIALHHLDDPSGAERATRKCIELAPKSAEYRLNLGMLLLTQQRFGEAAEAFRECVSLRPTLGLARFGLGESLLALGDRDGARNAFAEAIRLLPDDRRIKQRIEELDAGQKEAAPLP